MYLTLHNKITKKVNYRYQEVTKSILIAMWFPFSFLSFFSQSTQVLSKYYLVYQQRSINNNSALLMCYCINKDKNVKLLLYLHKYIVTTMETIGTSCYSSNFNYVGFSPFSTSTTCSYAHVNDDHYDIKPFDQYPFAGGSNGVVSYLFSFHLLF